jgi:hypothetical protein
MINRTTVFREDWVFFGSFWSRLGWALTATLFNGWLRSLPFRWHSRWNSGRNRLCVLELNCDALMHGWSVPRCGLKMENSRRRGVLRMGRRRKRRIFRRQTGRFHGIFIWQTLLIIFIHQILHGFVRDQSILGNVRGARRLQRISGRSSSSLACDRCSDLKITDVFMLRIINWIY